MSVELREAADGKLALRGHASVVEHWYPVGHFDEKINRGAFRRTLSEDPHVVLLINHGRDGGLPLASTRSSGGAPTLRLSEDARGLFTEADLHPRDPRVQSLRATAEQMPLEMSFGFAVTSDSWSEDRTKREVKGVNLNKGDVTVCPFGANDATSVTVDTRAGVLTLEQRNVIVEQLKGSHERRTAPGEPHGYAAHELAQLGAKGLAFANPDGHWSYPTKTRDDLEKAIQAVGRGGAEHNKIRHYLIGRAKDMGLSHLIPSNWAPSGAVRSIHLTDHTTRAAQELDILRIRRHTDPLMGLIGLPARSRGHSLSREELELAALSRR